jgi:hypothetical protein
MLWKGIRERAMIDLEIHLTMDGVSVHAHVSAGECGEHGAAGASDELAVLGVERNPQGRA